MQGAARDWIAGGDALERAVGAERLVSSNDMEAGHA
jgi:hypothetical protein